MEKGNISTKTILNTIAIILFGWFPTIEAQSGKIQIPEDLAALSSVKSYTTSQGIRQVSVKSEQIIKAEIKLFFDFTDDVYRQVSSRVLTTHTDAGGFHFPELYIFHFSIPLHSFNRYGSVRSNSTPDIHKNLT